MMKERQEKLNMILENFGRINQEAIEKHFLLSVTDNDGLMELYLILGVDPNANNKEAMQKLVNAGNLERIKLLRKYGGDINVDLENPINALDITVVSYMLSAGGEVKDKYLMRAIQTKNIEMTRLILKYNRTVTDHEMQLAIFVSVDMIKLLLPYTDNKFPEETFHDGDSHWGYIPDLPNNVLKYILYVRENEPDKFAEIDKETNSREFIFYLEESLKRSIEAANYPRIKLIANYFGDELQKITFVDPVCLCHDLVNSVKSAEKLNEILYFFKERGILQKVIPIEECIKYICEKGSIETLKIFDINPNYEHFEHAIVERNKELVEELIKAGIKPSKEDEEKAFEERTKGYQVKPEEGYEILRMIIRARES